MENVEMDRELEQVVVRPGFRGRCRQTALESAALVRMRNQAERAAQFPGSLVVWLQQLAGLADVDFAAVRQWAGSDLSPVATEAGVAYAKLGDALGLSRRFVRALALLGLAGEWRLVAGEAAGSIESPFARGGGFPRDGHTVAGDLGEIEAELDRIAARLDPAQLSMWRRMEGDIAGAPKLYEES